ncbi:uncharacterized protein METZ01_LOCUS95693 [marine metagenome]|uniref:Uncharacterized protein n=1 Tax=marine metagenome TaxID=408172 RepID=A0A381VR90_9ZZZZ
MKSDLTWINEKKLDFDRSQIMWDLANI